MVEMAMPANERKRRRVSLAQLWKCSMIAPVITLLFALPQESSALLRTMRPDRRSHAPWIAGRSGGKSVLIGHTGMGPAAAMRETKRLLAAHRPSLVVSTGFAGGLDPALRLGDAVLDFRDCAEFAVPGSLAWRGRIVSQGTLCETPGEKAALWSGTGASAVDMETASIADACGKAGVPVIALRVISDAAGDRVAVPLEHCYDMAAQRPRAAGLLEFLGRHPGRIVPFARFVSGLGVARAALARELPVLVAAAEQVR